MAPRREFIRRRIQELAVKFGWRAQDIDHAEEIVSQVVEETTGVRPTPMRPPAPEEQAYRARSVAFNDGKMLVTVDFDSGDEDSEDTFQAEFPLERYPALRKASSEALNNYKLTENGLGICWPNISQELSVWDLVGEWFDHISFKGQKTDEEFIRDAKIVLEQRRGEVTKVKPKG